MYEFWKKKHVSMYILIFGHQHYFKLSGVLNPYSIIMDYYKLFGNVLKDLYVMVIQNLFMKFSQCDYMIQKIIILNPFSS